MRILSAFISSPAGLSLRHHPVESKNSNDVSEAKKTAKLNRVRERRSMRLCLSRELELRFQERCAFFRTLFQLGKARVSALFVDVAVMRRRGDNS